MEEFRIDLDLVDRARSTRVLSGAMGPEEVAVRLLLETVADGNGRVTIPVDVTAVALQCGLRDAVWVLGDHARRSQDRMAGFAPAGGIAAVRPMREARFALACEIGRTVYSGMTGGEVDAVDGSGVMDRHGEPVLPSTDPAAWWIGRFGLALLMPAQAVVESWDEGLTINGIVELFDVTQLVVWHRALSLDLRSIVEEF